MSCFRLCIQPSQPHHCRSSFATFQHYQHLSHPHIALRSRFSVSFCSSLRFPLSYPQSLFARPPSSPPHDVAYHRIPVLVALVAVTPPYTTAAHAADVAAYYDCLYEDEPNPLLSPSHHFTTTTIPYPTPPSRSITTTRRLHILQVSKYHSKSSSLYPLPPPHLPRSSIAETSLKLFGDRFDDLNNLSILSAV